MRSLRLASAAAAFAFGALAGPVTAQTTDPNAVAAPAVRGHVQRRFETAGTEERIPRFVVQAIRFHANDETGSTNVGSDEIIAQFSTSGYQLITSQYINVDNNETRGFTPAQRCIYPAIDPDNTRNYAWSCRAEGGAWPGLFTISLREHDGEHSFGGIFAQCTGGALPQSPTDLFMNPNRLPCEVQSAASDLIGRFIVRKTIDELLAAMPAPGRFLQETVLLGGPCPPQPGLCNEPSDGEYEVTYRITRTADLVQQRPAAQR